MENIGVTLKVNGASAAISSVDKFNTSVDKLSATLGKGGAASAVFGAGLSVATTTINTASTALNQLNSTAGKLGDEMKKTGESASNSGSHFNKARSGADDTKGAFSTLAGAAGAVVGKLGDVASAAGGAVVSGLKDAAGAVLGLAGDFASAVGGMVIKAGEMGIDFVKSSIGVAADFDSSMRVIQATSDISGKDLKKLTDYAIDLGAKFPVSTKDVADGFGELTKAGFDYNQVMSAGQGLVTLSIAGNLSNAKSAEILAGSIRGFGLEAKDTNHVVDILAQTANASSIDVSDLEQTFKYAAPAAKALGFSIEDVSILSGVLGNNFIKGSTAGTGLAAIFSRMASPTAESAAAMKALGFNMADSTGKVRPLRDIMGELRTKFSGLSQVEQLDLAKKLAGQDAAKSLLSILNTSTDEWNKMTDAVDHADGAADKMASTMSGGTKGALDNLSGSVEALQIKIGTALAPALVFVSGKLGELVGVASNAFSEIMMGISNKDYEQGGEHMTTPFIEFGRTLRQTVLPAVKQVTDFLFTTVIPAAGQIAMVLITQVIPAVIGFATKIGQFLAPILASVTSFVTGTLIPGFMRFAQQAAPVIISAVQTVADFVVNRLIPGFISFAQTAAPIVQAAIQGIGQFITTIVIPAIGQLVSFWNTTLIPAFQTAAAWIQANLIPVFISIGDTFSNTIMPALGRFGDFIVTGVLPKLQSFGDWFGTTIMPVISQFIAFIADPLIPTIGKIAAVIMDTVIPTITNWIGIIANFLTPIFNALVGFISGTVIPVMGNIATFIGTTVVPAFQKIGDFINANVMPVLSTVASFLGGAFTVAFQNIGTVVGGVWEGIKIVISTAWSVISGIFNTITSILSGDFSGAWTAIKTTIGQVWSGISGLIDNSWNIVKGVLNNITGFLGGIFKGAWDGIKTAIETVWNGIVSAVQGGKNALDPIFTAIGSAIGVVQKVWDGLLEAVQKGAGVVAAVAKGDWSKAWDEISGGAKKGASTSVDEINKIATTIGNKNFSAEAAKAGATIPQGMAAGIAGSARSVVAAAENIASQAIAAAKGKLQSKSPSKVMIEEGHNFGDGFAIGIDDKVEPVRLATNRIIDNQLLALDGKRAAVKETIDRTIMPITGLPDVLDRHNPIIGRSMIDVWEHLAMVTDMKSGLVNDSIQKLITPIKDAANEIGAMIGTSDDPAEPVGKITDHIATIIGNAARKFNGDIDSYIAALRRLRGEMQNTVDNLPNVPGPASSGQTGTPLVGEGASTMPWTPVGAGTASTGGAGASVTSLERVSAAPSTSQIFSGVSSVSNTVNNNQYLTVNSAMESSGVINDYDLMRLMA
jgi:TP901 family phage tail tape measure protein